MVEGGRRGRAAAARAGARMFALVWGADADRAVRPLLAVSVLSAIAFSTFWSYVGIFAVESLGAAPGQVGFMYLLSAAAGAASNYAAGHLSDRIGRKGLIVAGLGAESVVVAALAGAAQHIVLGFGLLVLTSVVGSPAWALPNALVADLVPGERRETAYASVRVANNLGVTLGPPAGGVLIVLGGWPAFLFGVAGLGVVSALAALRLLPSPAPVEAEPGVRLGSLRLIARDRPFQLLLASQLLAFVVYVAFETVLPVIAVSSFGLAPSTWGFLVVLNPVLVTVFQLRLTRRVEGISAAVKLAAGVPLMGFSFLLLLLDTRVAILALVIVVFVFGEMLWVPTSQAIAARLAPAHARGAYMGAFTGAGSVAFMIAPLIGLQLRSAAGTDAVWFFFAAVSLAAAAMGIGASRAAPAAAAERPALAVPSGPAPPPEPD